MCVVCVLIGVDVNVAVFFEALPAVSLSPSMQIHASLYHIIGKRHIFAREPFSVGPEQVQRAQVCA